MGLCADVPDAELATGIAECEGFVAGAIVGHDAGHGHAEGFVPGHCRLEEGDRAFRRLVGEDVGEGDPRGIIDAHMDMFPAHAPAVGLAGPVAGDAVSCPLETAQGLDIQVDQLTGMVPLIAADRPGRVKVWSSPGFVDGYALADSSRSLTLLS